MIIEFDFSKGNVIRKYKPNKKATEKEINIGIEEEKRLQQENICWVFCWLNMLSDQMLEKLLHAERIRNYIKFNNEKLLQQLSNFISTGNPFNNEDKPLTFNQYRVLRTLAEDGIRTNVRNNKETIKSNETVEGLKMIADKHKSLRAEANKDIAAHQQEFKTKEAYVKHTKPYQYKTYDVFSTLEYTETSIFNILKNFNNDCSHLNSYKISDVVIDMQYALRKTRLTKAELNALRCWVNGEMPADTNEYKNLSHVVRRACAKLAETLNKK